DDEVAIALTRRGIGLAAATQLVDDLRHGRPVHPQMAAPEFVPARRSNHRRSAAVGEAESGPVTPSRLQPRNERRSHRPSQAEPRSKATVWFAGGIFACLLATGGVLLLKHRQQSHAGSEAAIPGNRPRVEASAT